jgi:DNA primase
MGLMKDFKDMKSMVSNAPGMIDEAQKMAANAQAMAAQQQQAAAAMMAQQQAAMAGPAVGPDFDPIDGVTLEQFAEVAKGLAEYNYDQNMAVQVAGMKGIPADKWLSASAAWNDRIKANPAVAQRFNALYTGRA